MSTVEQILALSTAGADVIRVTVPDDESADGIALAIWVLSSSQNPPPIIADIHFRHDLALKVIEYGVDGLRLNPGNIKDAKKIRQVAREAKDRGIPIRVGANAGSLHTQFLDKQGVRRRRRSSSRRCGRWRCSRTRASRTSRSR